MIFKEEKRNLFEVDSKYHLVHCISSDCKMGAGIAVEFQKRFKFKNYLLSLEESLKKHPQVIFCSQVFNLITKARYWHKPTYESVTECIKILKKQCELLDVKYLAMPKIGCGLDRLQWGKVREIVQEEFKDTDIEILACYL